MKRLSLTTKIFLYITIGILVGLVCRQGDLIELVKWVVTCREIFSQLLAFFIPLIIIGLVIPGIANLGKSSSKGIMVATIISFASTLSAGILSFFMGTLVLPMFVSPQMTISQFESDVPTHFMVEIPPVMSVITALVLSFVLGVELSKIKESKLLEMFQEFNVIIMKMITRVIIPLVPLYVGTIFVDLSFRGDVFETLISFTLVYLILFILQIVYVSILYLISGAIKRKSPIELLKQMLPAYVTGMGTQSSVATIPITLDCVRKNGVSDDVSEFVVPLVANIHLAGDTIALVITSMSIMYMNGQVPTLEIYLPFILMLGVTMIAAPGIPGGGVIAALGLLQSILGFGSVEKPLMLALHASQDSFGTATNVVGDGAIAIIAERFIKNPKFKKNT